MRGANPRRKAARWRRPDAPSLPDHVAGGMTHLRHRGGRVLVLFWIRGPFWGCAVNASQQAGRKALREIARRRMALALVVWTMAAHATDLVIYDESLENGFSTDYSYFGGTVVGSTDQAHTGTHSIAFTGSGAPQPFNALSFTGPTTYSTDDYPVLHFWIYGNAPGGQSLGVNIYSDRTADPDTSASLDQFISGGSVGSGVWREVTIPLTTAPLSFVGAVDRIDIQSETSDAQPTVYIDDVSLQSPVDDEIFANGFEGGTVLPPPANGLVETPNQTAGGMPSEVFAWYDSAGLPRSAALAYNDGAQGPGGSYGGELRQFQYRVGANTRTVNASSSSAAGFGYVVSHPDDSDESCLGTGDSSSLGHFTSGTWTRVFEGRHHAIFRFQQNYPRYCSTVGAAEHDIPVTIDWTFSTGRDNPVWSISYDLSVVSANVLEDDSRAPYGELLFDGSATESGHSVIAGVGWGDGYKFQSTTNPVTYNSAWTWNVVNTIPYVKLWTTAIDATMGTVQTQTLAQQDAGGYFDATFWGKTSASGPACPSGDGDSHIMPCSYNWDYQSINYSMGEAIGGSNSDSTNNTRLAWGTEFGFLGQTSYDVNGSTAWGGPRGNLTASGYPKKSYSVYVVLGVHSTDAVDAQVTQVENVQTVSLAATTGSVAVNGPAGVNRSDTITYSPTGYDPVYGALVFNASGNAIDATISVSGGTLKKPLIIIRNYTSSVYPTTVKFASTTLTMDTDYFPSLRTDKSELWITLNADLTGAGNRLQISP